MYIEIIVCNYFYCFSVQINAALVRIRYLFKKKYCKS